MVDLLKITDTYERRARLYPALICSSPLLVSCYILFPEAYGKLSVLVTMLISVGLLQFISHLARDRGKRLEQGLHESWGGVPSVKFLRYDDLTFHRVVKAKYHKILYSKSDIAGPTEEEERTNPEEANAIYRSWSDYLRACTRDTKTYGLLFEENINYGFRRNLLGLKPFCLLFVAIALIVTGWNVYSNYSKIQVELGVEKLAAIFSEIAFLLTVLFVVRPDWVRIPAEAYARRLIETLDQ